MIIFYKTYNWITKYDVIENRKLLLSFNCNEFLITNLRIILQKQHFNVYFEIKAQRFSVKIKKVTLQISYMKIKKNTIKL